MKHLTLILFSFFLLTSCHQLPDYPSLSKSSLSKELIETKADFGLLILLKDSKAVAKANLIFIGKVITTYSRQNGIWETWPFQRLFRSL